MLKSQQRTKAAMATMVMTVTTARKANDATFMTITVTKIVTLVMTVTTTRAILTPNSNK
jgi:hypothetical protein